MSRLSGRDALHALMPAITKLEALATSEDQALQRCTGRLADLLGHVPKLDHP